MKLIEFKKKTAQKYADLDGELTLLLAANPSTDLVYLYITKMNQAHIESGEEPYLIWLLNQFINHGDPELDISKLALYHKYGLNCKLKTTVFNQKVSVLTYLSQTNRLDLIRYFVETVQIKIEENEPIHPIGLSQIASLSRQPNDSLTTVHQYLIDNLSTYSDAPYSLATLTARYGYEKIFNSCVNTSTINKLDGLDFSPLMHAVIHGRKKIIECLFTKNVNPLVKNSLNQTVFHLLFTNSDQKYIDFLIKKYPVFQENIYTTSDKAKDIDGLLPIHYAVLFNQVDWIKNTSETHPELINYIDNSGRSLISFCPQNKHLPLLKWLNTRLTQSVSLYAPALKALLSGAIEYRSDQIIAWCLSQTKLDLNAHYKEPGQPANLNIAQLLCKTGQSDHIVDSDLYRKSEYLLFDKDNFGRTSIDYFFLETDQQILTNYVASGIKLMRYVLSVMAKLSNQKSFSMFSEFRAILIFCLNHNLIKINDTFEENSPTFHCIESYFYSQYQKTLSCESFAQMLDIDTEQISREWLVYYQYNIRFFIQTYQPTLNKTDAMGLHLFSKLAKLGPDGFARIQWLFDHIPGFTLYNLSPNGSSLLHLACEEQYFDMVRWCCDKKQLSILKQRSDKMSALDLALLSKNKLISKYLISKLSNKQRTKYVESLTIANKRDLLESLEFHGFYEHLLQNNLIVNDNHEQTIIDSPIVGRCFEKADNPQCLQNNDDNRVAQETNDELIITYDIFIAAIADHQTKIIKKLKQDSYQDTLRNFMTLHSQEILEQILATPYSIMYQCLRVSAIRALIEANITYVLKQLIKKNEVRILLLLLNQISIKNYLDKTALDLLLYASSLKNQDVLLLLLSEPLFSSIAHENNNQLLRDSAKEGWTQIVLRLCEIDKVILTADVFENEALRNAIDINDFESCAFLLRLDCVRNALKNDSYLLIKNLIENEYDDALEIMLQLPEIYNYVVCHFPNRVCIQNSKEVAFLSNADPQAAYYAQIPNKNIPYFFNPNYYVAPVNCYEFFDAIISNDLTQLEKLFFSYPDIHPNLIRKIAFFSVRHGQVAAFNCIFELANPVFVSNPLLCNQLLCEAISRQKDDIAEQLFNSNLILKVIDGYNNRLLRCAIRYGSEQQVLRLLANSTVCENLTAMNNYALRWSSALGRFQLVKALLQYESVRVSAAAFNFYSLRKALYAEHHDIVMLLLDVHHFLDYAVKQNGIYNKYILEFAINEITRYIQNQVALSEPQLVRLSLFRRYLPNQSDHKFCSLLNSLDSLNLNNNSQPSVVTVSMFLPDNLKTPDTADSDHGRQNIDSNANFEIDKVPYEQIIDNTPQFSDH